MTIYSFIAEEWASSDNDWTISEMCRVLEVSRSGFYGWQSRPRSEREVTDALTMAVATRGGTVNGVVFPSDRGSQLRFKGRCNTALLGRVWKLVEGLGRCLPAEGLAWSVVEGESDGVEVVSGVSGQVGSFREVLAEQSVGVLVGAALPGALRVAEEDCQAGGDAQ